MARTIKRQVDSHLSRIASPLLDLFHRLVLWPVVDFKVNMNKGALDHGELLDLVLQILAHIVREPQRRLGSRSGSQEKKGNVRRHCTSCILLPAHFTHFMTMSTSTMYLGPEW